MTNGPRAAALTDRVAAAARAVRDRAAGGRRAPVAYRHGIRNFADESLAAHVAAQRLIDQGILTLGDYSYVAPTVHVFPGDTSVVRIGRYTSLAHGVELFVGGAHRVDWVSTYAFRGVFGLPGAYEDGMPASRGDIEIGSDCWLATDSVVLSGVTIGDGAVVGTRAVVTKDVRPYAIVAGNPAREVRRRFSDEQVEALLRIRWWDWPVETVLERVDQLNGGGVDRFIERFDPA